jgi:hypothetical protein
MGLSSTKNQEDVSHQLKLELFVCWTKSARPTIRTALVSSNGHSENAHAKLDLNRSTVLASFQNLKLLNLIL